MVINGKGKIETMNFDFGLKGGVITFALFVMMT